MAVGSVMSSATIVSAALGALERVDARMKRNEEGIAYKAIESISGCAGRW